MLVPEAAWYIAIHSLYGPAVKKFFLAKTRT